MVSLVGSVIVALPGHDMYFFNLVPIAVIHTMIKVKIQPACTLVQSQRPVVLCVYTIWGYQKIYTRKLGNPDKSKRYSAFLIQYSINKFISQRHNLGYPTFRPLCLLKRKA